ncbi:YibE/F family protein [Candidatus Collierbacteria bacterium]|nr:YibE/F family protein [Candidatus Collierbacteria bacterium]
MDYNRGVIKRWLMGFWISFSLLLTTAGAILGSSGNTEQVLQAEVLEITEEGVREVGGYEDPFQLVKVKLLDGMDTGEELTVEHGVSFSLNKSQLVKKGDRVVVNRINDGESINYFIIDKLRLSPMVYIAIGFFILVIMVAGWKGVGSFIGMIFSLLVIVKFIVPLILDGKDPLLVSLGGSLMILFASMYLAHGYSRQTTIAMGTTLLCLIITGVISVLMVAVTKLTGMGSEDAYSLQMGPTQMINLRGLLLGGMIIGALGVLDDITTSQVAAVFELKKANPKLNFKRLVSQAKAIGVEHTASLVNTLVMAYAGVAMPVLILLVINPAKQPLWFIFNSEIIAEEVIRTLAGSIGLVLAVPITTLVAAWYVSSRGVRECEVSAHHH